MVGAIALTGPGLQRLSTRSQAVAKLNQCIRLIAPQRQQIAASDFTFDNEAEPFEEGLDRPIEQCLQNRFLRFALARKQASGV
jgi:hypothetical protein